MKTAKQPQKHNGKSWKLLALLRFFYLASSVSIDILPTPQSTLYCLGDTNLLVSGASEHKSKRGTTLAS